MGKLARLRSRPSDAGLDQTVQPQAPAHAVFARAAASDGFQEIGLFWNMASRKARPLSRLGLGLFFSNAELGGHPVRKRIPADARRNLSAPAQAKLLQYIVHVVLDRGGANSKLARFAQPGKWKGASER